MTRDSTPDLRNLARYYDDRYSTGYMDEHARLEHRRLADVLSGVPNRMNVRTVLDYGCGSGPWIPLLQSHFPHATIVGVDISSQAIQKARTRHPDANFAVMRGAITGFDKCSFDVVFSFHVLEHVANLDTTLADMARILTPAGHLVVVMPSGNEGSFEERLTRKAVGGRDEASGRFYFEDSGHLRRVASDVLVARVAAHGLELRDARFANQFWGAIDWMSCSTSEVLRAIFDRRRASGPTSAMAFATLRGVLTVLSCAVRLHRATQWARLRQMHRRHPRTLLSLLLLPAKLVAAPLAISIESLAAREWHQKSRIPTGSAHYLTFVKPVTTAREGHDQRL